MSPTDLSRILFGPPFNCDKYYTKRSQRGGCKCYSGFAESYSKRKNKVDDIHTLDRESPEILL